MISFRSNGSRGAGFKFSSDGKTHNFAVQCCPSVLGHPFQFYMVNRCSSGVVPSSIQWGNAGTVRISGESIHRSVPLQFERKSFPSNLMPVVVA
jgi:hypothetical protein